MSAKLSYTLPSDTAALIEEYKKAKKVLSEWDAYKKQLTEQLLHRSGVKTEDLERYMRGNRVGSLRLPLGLSGQPADLELSATLDMKVDSGLALAAIGEYPEMLGQVFRQEFKAGTPKVVLGALSSDGKVAKAASQAVSVRLMGPYLTVAKA